jgi:hypothetical protein
LEFGVAGAEGGELACGFVEAGHEFGRTGTGAAIFEGGAEGVAFFAREDEFLFQDLVLGREVRISGVEGGIAGGGLREAAEMDVAAAAKGYEEDKREWGAEETHREVVEKGKRAAGNLSRGETGRGRRRSVKIEPDGAGEA